MKSWSLWISSSPLLCRFGGDFFAFLVGARDSGGGVGFGGELFAVLVGVGGTGSGLGDVVSDIVGLFAVLVGAEGSGGGVGFGVDLFAVLVGVGGTGSILNLFGLFVRVATSLYLFVSSGVDI